MSLGTILFFALAALSSIALPQCRAQNPALRHVAKIYVSQMGSGEQADRFHSSLQDELRKVGFEVAERPSADAFTNENARDLSASGAS